MAKLVDPGEFGLSARTILEDGGQGQLIIVIDRKSRLIMADGRKIVTKAEKIRALRPETTILLQTTAPLCSKTKSFLEENGIGVI